MNVQNLTKRIAAAKEAGQKPTDIVLTKDEHKAISQLPFGELHGKVTTPTNNNTHIEGATFTSMVFDGVRLHVSNS